MSLHRLWIAEHVHDDGSDAVPGDDVHHGGLPQSGDIVHDGSPGLDCLRGHLGLHRVDGKRYVDFGDQVTDYRTDPAPLFIRSHRIRSGSSRLTAHVEDIGPVFHHLEPMAEGLIRIEVAPTVGERIGGDVEDPHHPRPVQANLAGPMAPDVRAVCHSDEQWRIPISRCAGPAGALYLRTISGRPCGSCSSTWTTSSTK